MKRMYFKIKNRILNFLFPRRNRLSKKSQFDRRVGTLTKSILENNGVDINVIHFTDIKADKYKNKIIITYTMLRPGLLIGKKGQTIDMLTEHLSNYFDREIQYVIKEKWLWY